jgi:hypothetical protein
MPSNTCGRARSRAKLRLLWLGDAVRFIDPVDVNKGFLFDGRFAEDFKLASGTWVSVGPLRAARPAAPQAVNGYRPRRSWPPGSRGFWV